MDPIRQVGLQPSYNTAPAAAPQARPQTQQAPGDSVQISTGKSSLLDKAKNLGLGASVGLSATVLLDAAALAGAAAVIGTASGLVALVATGMAAVHFGKKMFAHKNPAPQQAPAPPPPAPAPPAPSGIPAPPTAFANPPTGFNIAGAGIPQPPRPNA